MLESTQVGEGTDRRRRAAPAGRWALFALLPACVLSATSACTFYTGCPDQPPPGTGNTSAGGSSSNGGSSDGGGSLSGGSGGGAGEGAEPRAWQEAAGNLEGRAAGCGVVFLATHPARDEVFVGIDRFGLWTNTDGTTDWSALGTSGMSAVISNGVSHLVFDPEDPDTYWEAGIYNGPGGFRTTDGGVTFTQLGNLNHVDTIAVDFTDPDRQTLIAGPHERSKVILKSTDGGETWVELTNLPEDLGFSSNVMIVDASTYLVGCTNAIIRTTDGGDSWTVVSKLGGFQAPLVTPDGTIYWNADAGQGMVKSTDQGENWERIVGGGVINTAEPPLQLPDGRLAALQGDGVAISEDDGFSWQQVGADVPYTIKGFVYSADRRAFYVSTDGCDVPIAGDAILKLDFDYTAE